METHEIKYFLALVRELNFTKAAEACGVTQPALTRAIQKLEAEFGGALFLRRPGKIEMTRLARKILPDLEKIETSIAEVRRQADLVRQAGNQSLRIAVMCTVGPTHLIPLIERLRIEIPDLELSIVDAKAREVVSLIIQDEVDIGISAWPHYPDSVHVETLLTERYAVAMREDDVLASMESVEVDRMAGQNYIDRLGCEFDDYYSARHGEWKIGLNTVFASEREDWVQALLVAGLGYAIVPENMRLAQGLICRPLCAPEVTREIALLSLRGRRLPPAAAYFVRIAKSGPWFERNRSLIRPPGLKT